MDKPFALVIEDDGNIAALYRQVDLAGSQTEIIFHGQIAVERLSKSQPDIVLLDLSLPGISGNWILEWIRQDGRLNHTKVLVITAHAHLAGGLIVQPDLLLQKAFQRGSTFPFNWPDHPPGKISKSSPSAAKAAG